ncbi:acetyl-CoA carboxylase biotin carboxylase subunit [Sneathiella sp. CAU 1612]|uniref:Acetyl-CoA carboxylase biotin carboxylase subunit n=1 Tax=Sneathiella sedimenti TaxID=2816034 RepID=A0ABS3F0S4_9PROT|nr:acetyl-CoA carboxylase biotin carboxylase subunit [Sneathiella sedimenti]MBO0332019.1 acetyl-CoA carboxylase biotin carboxylase subunit [Sneathiella sedimenti]
MRNFNSILVANRGEIAVRVIKSAKSLGYRTIAVYSEADAAALHVRMADEAVLIGPAPVQQSYLDMAKILAAAKEAGAEAIHPGYGFLSENAEFARACEAAGIVFIGPSAEAIDLMGNKAAAKRRMIAAKVPCVPGYEDPDQSDDTLINAAKEIGFPIMVKAAAGGGGRGMRLVHEEKNLAGALASARSEALNAFGSEELILEKAIIEPRHVEVQVFADSHGNVIHLGERDCSVQRRHQKVVEEAPCPVMTPELREKMGAAAVEAARSINYRGAGTVEFLLDAGNNFYFLEMNTRLQVEHPVTELVTGIDLVSLQIKVAQGEPLGMAQKDVALQGHAIEVRLYAEDTTQDFLPCTGRISRWQAAEGEGIRFDVGIDAGQEISPFYDPMIAKVIAYGESREIARHRLIEALKNTVLFGLTTNRGFLIDILNEETFARGEATTAFIGELFDENRLAAKVPSDAEMAMAAVLFYQVERDKAASSALFASDQLMDWSSGGDLLTRYVFAAGDGKTDVTVSPRREGGYKVMVGDTPLVVDVMGRSENKAQLTVDGNRRRVHYDVPSEGVLELTDDGKTLRFANEIAVPLSAAGAAGSGQVIAPMHGTLLDVFVKAGDTVEVGTRLAVLEAMKMQHDILAEVSGVVQNVIATAASQVSVDDLLFEIEASE